MDECQQLLWRLSLLLDPVPDPDGHEPFHDSPPHDLTTGVQPSPDAITVHTPDPPDREPSDAKPDDIRPPAVIDEPDQDRWVDADLAVAAMITRRPLDPSDADLRRQLDRRDAWHTSPVTPDRLLQANQLALDFYQDHYTPEVWSRHLPHRPARRRHRRRPPLPTRPRPRHLDCPHPPPPKPRRHRPRNGTRRARRPHQDRQDHRPVP